MIEFRICGERGVESLLCEVDIPANEIRVSDVERCYRGVAIHLKLPPIAEVEILHLRDDGTLVAPIGIVGFQQCWVEFVTATFVVRHTERRAARRPWQRSGFI